MLNLLELGKFWKDFSLDSLIVATHDPGQSALNPIERAWFMLSRLLAGVTLPISLPDERPPSEQSNLTEEDCQRIERLCLTKSSQP